MRAERKITALTRTMDPAEVVQRLIGSGKDVTPSRVNKIPRLIASEEDYQTFLQLLSDQDADAAALVQSTADTSRAKGETTWVFP